jgi:hypothetical protein
LNFAETAKAEVVCDLVNCIFYLRSLQTSPAAPDMLESLRRCVVALASVDPETQIRAINDASAAIEKATGAQ